jgi:mRNA interferase MazF
MVTIFEQGDIVYLNFDPQAGHEQRGRRPALVVSNNLYNRVSSLTMVCPITHTDREHPFHVKLDSRTKTAGVILCDQCRMLDLNSRQATFVEKAPDDLLAEAVDLIQGFIEIR